MIVALFLTTDPFKSVTYTGNGSTALVPPLTVPTWTPLVVLPFTFLLVSGGGTAFGGGASWMAWDIALWMVSNQSCISREPSAWSRRTRTGEVTLKEKFLSVSFTSAGWRDHMIETGHTITLVQYHMIRT